jgi:hypothetical protein
LPLAFAGLFGRCRSRWFFASLGLLGLSVAASTPVADVLAGHHVVNLASHEPTLEEMFLEYYEDQPPEVRT